MTEPADTVAQIITDILSDMADCSEPAPLLDMHQLVNHQPSGPLRIRPGAEAIHHSRLNKDSGG